MARARLVAVLASSAIQATSANFIFTTMKTMVCQTVKVPFVCSSSSSSKENGNLQRSSGSGVGSCVGNSCCPDSSCYSLPGTGCATSRGHTTCVGSAFMPPSAGQCMCKQGSCNSEGKCSEGGSFGMMGEDITSRLFEVDHSFRHPPEDHSRALALYSGGACLLVVAGLSAGVRQLRRRGSSQEMGQGGEEAQHPQWELLEQVSSSGEVD